MSAISSGTELKYDGGNNEILSGFKGRVSLASKTLHSTTAYAVGRTELPAC